MLYYFVKYAVLFFHIEIVYWVWAFIDTKATEDHTSNHTDRTGAAG
jgi:hypothetical protein